MTSIPYTLKDVKDASAQEKFTVISTFAGGGGSSTGYRLAGGKVLAINEFVEEAANTYSQNYPDTKVLPGDIKELTGNDFLKAVGLEKGELDILDGSPPCSAFSIANRSGERYGKEKVYSDGKKVQNIEDLFFEFIRIVDDIRPKVVVAENVKGLAMDYAREYFAQIQQKIEALGYYCDFRVLDASRFGVPQSRQRCFFVAVREDIADQVGLNYLTIGNVFPSQSAYRTTLRDAGLYDLWKAKDADNEAMAEELREKMKTLAKYQWVVQVEPNPKRIVKMSEVHPRGSYFHTKKHHWDLPGATMTQLGCQTHMQTHLHPEEDRGFTLKEFKRIMSLPDDYILTGTVNQQLERVGRMVAPLQMEALANSIYDEVLRHVK